MSKKRDSEFELLCALDDLEYELPEYAHEYLRPAFYGDADAAGALAFAADYGQPNLLVAEGYRLQIPPQALKRLLHQAITHVNGVGLLELMGSRHKFSQMCRYAGVDLPANLPAGRLFTGECRAYRPRKLWLVSIGLAASDVRPGSRPRYRTSPRIIVVEATIHRASIVFYTAEREEDEVIPEKAPDRYEVSDDYDQIAEAAMLYKPSMCHTAGAGGTGIGSPGPSDLSTAAWI